MPDDIAKESAVALTLVTISFDQRRFLRDCIDSVLPQLRPGIDQYIVVDPGSTDGSRAVIRGYGDSIDECIVEPDAGPADGLNRGFSRGHGEIFGYINADDRLVPGALAYVRAYFAAEPEIDVLTGAIRIIDAQGLPGVRGRTSDTFDLRRFIAGACVIGQQATWFRREAWVRAGGFNPANRVMWDSELLVDMALTGARFATVPRVLGDWRRHGEAITSSRGHRARMRAEFARCREKLDACGVDPLGPMQSCWARLRHRFDVLRHISYLQAGGETNR